MLFFALFQSSKMPKRWKSIIQIIYSECKFLSLQDIGETKNMRDRVESWQTKTGSIDSHELI